MTRTWTITILRTEQPIDAVWAEIDALVAKWNQRDVPQFTGVGGFMWLAVFDVRTYPLMEGLVRELDDLHRASGSTFHLTSRTHLEDVDYERADFIEIIGVGLGESAPFIVNEATAFAPPVACPACGWADMWLAAQVEPLQIDETQLARPVSDEPAPDGDWDLVNLPNGGKLVSRRLAGVLEGEEVDGYQLHEVFDADSKRTSKRMFQLVAEKSIFVPCLEHSRVAGGPFCPSCGTAHGSLEDYFWIRNHWIDGDDVISRHPNKGAMLYVGSRVYRSLARLNGIHRNEIMLVCEHS